jgi:hypothetical protein
MVVDCLSRGGGGTKPPGQTICLGFDCLGPWWTRSLMEKSAFTRMNLFGVSDHGDYVCSCGRVVMSGSNRTDFSTQVLVVRCAWTPMVMSYHARHEMSLLPEDPAPIALTWYWRTPRCGCRGTGCVCVC